MGASPPWTAPSPISAADSLGGAQPQVRTLRHEEPSTTCRDPKDDKFLPQAIPAACAALAPVRDSLDTKHRGMQVIIRVDHR
jgi:hypothetical protein